MTGIEFEITHLPKGAINRADLESAIASFTKHYKRPPYAIHVHPDQMAAVQGWCIDLELSLPLVGNRGALANEIWLQRTKGDHE